MDPLRVVIVDMQPIDPPIGGGRLRLLGLYSGLSNEINAVYVGSFDWKGPQYREIQLSKCLTEVDIPLSEEHFIAHETLALKLGKPCIDIAFPLQGHLSEAYIARVCNEIRKAQVIIFSHPWVFPFVREIIDEKKQLIIYDSQNCEGLLRVKLNDDGTELADKLCRTVVRCEYELCASANYIFACSDDDKKNFVRLYDIPEEKILIVPNGVFTEKISPCDETHKEILRKRMNLNKITLCFIGSSYYPNEEAARLIIDVAKELPQYQFIIIGGVGENLKKISDNNISNVLITGPVEEWEKIEYLHMSDIALNPMLSGSGTNIKMFDFMAAGLPIICTEVGARGISNTNGNIYRVCKMTKEGLKAEILTLVENKNAIKTMKCKGRKEACEKYSWERISYELGYKIRQKYRKTIKKECPYFSVIIPTYERHDLLERLLQNLLRQTFRNFEIIIVDQSEKTFNISDEYKALDIIYFKTDVKGATKARNAGIRLAKGYVGAFIDDDCIPSPTWMENARKYFLDDNVVGVEGLIRADTYDEKIYRIVSNIGFEGIGFMTANLFIRLDILNKLNGFDENFDEPHFREDTDLGWRASVYGNIPYGKNVEVLHPSHLRSNKRESADERNKFYVHDPLLLQKHPIKFKELFFAEGHYKEDEYWKYFKEGLQRHSLDKSFLDVIINDARCDDFIKSKIREL